MDERRFQGVFWWMYVLDCTVLRTALCAGLDCAFSDALTLFRVSRRSENLRPAALLSRRDVINGIKKDWIYVVNTKSSQRGHCNDWKRVWMWTIQRTMKKGPWQLIIHLTCYQPGWRSRHVLLDPNVRTSQMEVVPGKPLQGCWGW